jgi:hypothetical protein
MGVPRNMTAYTLNALKGWPQPAAVDFNTEFSSDIVDVVLPGSVVHLNSSGQYELGIGNLKAMPLFMFNGSDDPDVINESPDPATEKGVWVPINPTGQAMALVGIGAYELVSTSFVSGTYNPNDPLTSDVSGSNAGLLEVGTWWTDTICGVVSRGVVDNGYGYDAVAFWPVFIPSYP